MTARASALVLLVAILKIDAAGAQSTREVRFDAGVAQVQQTGRDTRDAAGIFALSWREGNPLIATRLSAAITSAGDSASAAQLALAAAWRVTESSPWLTEGGMSAAAFGQTILARGGSFSGFIRERRAIDAGGVWLGAALGGTSRDNIASHSTAFDAGGWWRIGEFEASASVTRLRSEDVPLLQAAELFLTGDATVYDLVDIATDLHYEHGPFYLEASETFRNGLRATTANQSALYISAVYTFSPRYSFIIGTGRLLADPVRGIPDAQVTSAAVRVALIPVRAATPPAETRGAAFATLSPKSSGALLVVRVVADDAAQVELAGSFSDWKPVPLTRTTDGWEAEIALPPGSHRVAVRINGGHWQAPRGTARVKDDYGGSAGLIVVP
jgi:hypothetical protein